MSEKPREHQAFMVRIWPVKSEAGTLWHASLENAHTGERCGFPTLEDLFDYLRAQTADDSVTREEVHR
jgi:hypothetical protein